MFIIRLPDQDVSSFVKIEELVFAPFHGILIPLDLSICSDLKTRSSIVLYFETLAFELATKNKNRNRNKDSLSM